MPKITSLNRLAAKQGFRAGDDVVSLGGYEMRDILDYLYFDNEKTFTAEVLRNGKKHTIKVRKKPEETLGLEFDLEMKPMRCRNKCVFCFVDQLPEHLRETLYVKDDDYRYSFISGCYVTLTNLPEEEIDRIIRLKLSPIYISVHAFTDEVRRKLVTNPNTQNLIDRMRRMGENGIVMHTQLVIVPGINDGEELVKSIRGLHGIQGVETVAVVPVGLTAHREGLADIRMATREEAEVTVDAVEKLNAEYGAFCWCSDEYYLKAGRAPREYSYYGDFAQIENGVGLFAEFYDNVDYSLSECTDRADGKKLGFITGVDFAPFLREKLKEVDAAIGTSSTVFGVINNFFGKTITVAGLVTASDITSQVDASGLDAVVIPDNMLKEFGEVFLDNVSVSEVSRKLGVPVIRVAHNGADFAGTITQFFREGV